MLELVDTLSHTAGAHAFRGGFDLLHNDTTITFPRSVRGAYTFSSLANFLSGTYNNGGFAQTFGDPVVGQSNPNLGFFVQDLGNQTARIVAAVAICAAAAGIIVFLGEAGAQHRARTPGRARPGLRRGTARSSTACHSSPG